MRGERRGARCEQRRSPHSSPLPLATYAWPEPVPIFSRRSEPFLTLQQVLHERLVEADARIHRDVIDVRLGALGAEELAEAFQGLKVIGPGAASVHRQLLVALDV